MTANVLEAAKIHLRWRMLPALEILQYANRSILVLACSAGRCVRAYLLFSGCTNSLTYLLSERSRQLMPAKEVPYRWPCPVLIYSKGLYQLHLHSTYDVRAKQSYIPTNCPWACTLMHDSHLQLLENYMVIAGHFLQPTYFIRPICLAASLRMYVLNVCAFALDTAISSCNITHGLAYAAIVSSRFKAQIWAEAGHAWAGLTPAALSACDGSPCCAICMQWVVAGGEGMPLCSSHCTLPFRSVTYFCGAPLLHRSSAYRKRLLAMKWLSWECRDNQHTSWGTHWESDPHTSMHGDKRGS